VSRAPRQINPRESVRHLFAWTLRDLRTQAGSSLQGFAKRLGKSDSYLSAVELAQARSTRAFAQACDDLLGAEGRLVDLWVHADQDWDRLSRKDASLRRAPARPDPEPADQAVRIVEVPAGADLGGGAMVVWCVNGKVYAMPTRRELLKLLGAGAVVGTVGLPVERQGVQLGDPRVMHAMRVAQQASASRLGADTVEQLQRAVEYYAGVFRRTLPEMLYPELLSVRLHVGGLLDSKLTLSQHRDLVVTAGWLSNLLGLVCFDLGDQLAAAAWCADVEERSREAGHPELAAWAAQTNVLMAFYGGQAREAVAHAQNGQTLTPLGTVVHAKLAAQEMRAWALLGDIREVRSAQRRAEQAMATLPIETPARAHSRSAAWLTPRRTPQPHYCSSANTARLSG
jgi:transcriptional regulator with XRE-family HTH domain